MSWDELIGPDFKKSAALIGPDLIRFSPDTNITKSAARLKSLMIAWLRTKFAKHYWCFDILQNSVRCSKSKCKIAFGPGMDDLVLKEVKQFGGNWIYI